MSVICKACNNLEDKQVSPGLVCDVCKEFVHVKCLSCVTTPGAFADDVFFDYTCSNCSYTKEEYLRRNKFLFTWLSVIYLTIHHLTIHAYGISNHGFFHYKTHIASFIDRHWNELFEASFKQKKSWIGTIAGKLSSHNGLYFRSGLAELGESGWWKLEHDFSPAVAVHIAQEIAREKPRIRGQKSQSPLDRTLFIEKVTDMGYGALVSDTNFRPPTKRARLDSGQTVPLPLDTTTVQAVCAPPLTDNRGQLHVGDMVYLPEPVTWMPEVTDEPEPTEEITPTVQSFTHTYSDTSSVHSNQRSNEPEAEAEAETDSRSGSPQTYEFAKTSEKIKKEKESKEAKHYVPRAENLFSDQLNSMDMPWLAVKEENKDLVQLSEYEEVQLLKQVEGMIGKVSCPMKKAELRRFKAKLTVRRLKRHKRLPVFEFDNTLRILGGYVSGDSNAASSAERVLDRFQRTWESEAGGIWGSEGVEGGTRCAVTVRRGGSRAVRSPHSGARLAPLVRRAAPPPSLPRLALMAELMQRTHRDDPLYRPVADAPLEYSYVRPEHIPAVNTLCQQHFWPGIDLTEALQYPEFSCVVTYKQLLVACAFLVPDVSPTEAYISFVVVRPDWRGAKIATFMLYHLLQTCTGKDVTLHVSPTNPAIFLYQKFGFKVEELIQDFYEKYYDAEFKGCRHALFLRLVR